MLLVTDTGGPSLLTLGVLVLVAYVGVLYVACAYFVFRDARRRSTSPPFIAMALLLGFLFPFLGALIYLVVRPPRTLDEERALILEEQTLLGVEAGDVLTRPCPACGREIESEFIVCPHCRTHFARRCRACDRILRLGWPVCPYCGEELGAPTLPRPVH